MSKLSDAVKTTRRFVIGFIIFSILVVIVQLILSRLEETTITPGISEFEYYIAPNAFPNTYSRFELNSLTLSNISPSEFVIVGDFPEFPPVINSYPIQEPQVRLSALEEAEEIASKFSLNPIYRNVGENIYIWDRDHFELEFNTLTQSLNYTSDLIKSKNNELNLLEDSEYIQNATNLMSTLGILDQNNKITGEVIFVSVNPNGLLTSVENIEDADYVRVSLFSVLQSATLNQSYRNSNQEGIPDTITSQVFRENITDGFINILFTNEAKAEEDIVQLDFLPYSYEEAATTQNQGDSAFKFETYESLDLGEAFENLKVKTPGTFLFYIRKPGESLFSPFQQYNVSKFSIDAPKTKTIFIESKDWDHLNPESEWQGRNYPFYWFEGTATLDNGEIANFVFLVDAVPRN